MGLTQVLEAPYMFTNDDLVVFFYVDDIVILCHLSKHDIYEEFKVKLMKAYKMRFIRELKYFLRIRVIRDRSQRKIWLLQDTYLEKIASTFPGSKDRDPKHLKVPTKTQKLVPRTDQATAHEIHSYQRLIGSLTYPVAITRADMAQYTQKLAEFLQNPSKEHAIAALEVLQHLYLTRYYALEYSREDRMQAPMFVAASDASFTDNIATQYSTEGILFKLFRGLIDWSCVKQATVTTSTTEAELLALSHLIAWLM
jgi:hypothetical protein